MTAQQVKNATGAETFLTGTKNTGQNLSTNLGLDFELDRKPFRAWFFVDGAVGLQAVELVCQKPKDVVLRDYLSLKALIIERYGQPFTEPRNETGTGPFTSLWKFETTWLWVYFLQGETLSVAYDRLGVNKL
jgi:hypothetical protein